jgi:hypothetical protein
LKFHMVILHLMDESSFNVNTQILVSSK